MGRFLYVIGCEPGPKKIGIALDPKRRLNSLRGGSPVDIQLLLSVDTGDRCARDVERAAHAALADKRLRGEWFDISMSEAETIVGLAIEGAPMPRPSAELDSHEDVVPPLLCRAARKMLGLSQDELAKAVGVSDRTIHGFEKGQGRIARPTQLAIRKVLEARGVRFIAAEGELGVLVRAA